MILEISQKDSENIAKGFRNHPRNNFETIPEGFWNHLRIWNHYRQVQKPSLKGSGIIPERILEPFQKDSETISEEIWAHSRMVLKSSQKDSKTPQNDFRSIPEGYNSSQKNSGIIPEVYWNRFRNILSRPIPEALWQHCRWVLESFPEGFWTIPDVLGNHLRRNFDACQEDSGIITKGFRNLGPRLGGILEGF